MQLASHLKNIKGNQRYRKIPLKTPALLSHQELIPVLGGKGLNVKLMDSSHLNNKYDFEADSQNLSNERKLAAVGDKVSEMQTSS